MKLRLIAFLLACILAVLIFICFKLFPNDPPKQPGLTTVPTAPPPQDPNPGSQTAGTPEGDPPATPKP